jgi:putative transposase
LGGSPSISPVPFNADIIQADFSRDSTGCYYVSFLLKEEYRLIPRPQKTVGIDLGTRNIAITSDGLMIPSPNPMSRYEGKMRAEKKRISKMVPGSKNYRKSCRQLARVYRHCQNIREDTIHKATIRLIRNNGFIGKESLNLEEMEKTKKAFRRKLLDVNISSFMEKLLYKADWHNRVVVSVSPYFPSSQLCCNCNTVYPEAKIPVLPLGNVLSAIPTTNGMSTPPRISKKKPSVYTIITMGMFPRTLVTRVVEVLPLPLHRQV